MDQADVAVCALGLGAAVGSVGVHVVHDSPDRTSEVTRVLLLQPQGQNLVDLARLLVGERRGELGDRVGFVFV